MLVSKIKDHWLKSNDRLLSQRKIKRCKQRIITAKADN